MTRCLPHPHRSALTLLCQAFVVCCGCTNGGQQTSVDSQAAALTATRRAAARDLDGPFQFYFGNLHAHTAYSDGRESPQAGYAWARDVMKLHFYAVTDHAERISAEEWRLTGEAAAAFSAPGRFVALRGFEHSVDFLRRGGHANIFGTEDRLGLWDALSMNVAAVYDWVRQRDGLMQFNHPGRPSGVFDDLKLRPSANPWVVAIETGNKNRGNNSGEYLGYYQRALDAGWRLAPANNQDNHALKLTCHRTVVIARELTRAAVLGAMRQMRQYSSDDPNMRVTFKVRDAWMGSEVPVHGNSVKLTIAVEDDEPITKIEVVTNGGVVAAKRHFSKGPAVSWQPTVDTRGRTFFYIKVYERNVLDADGGHSTQIAVTAPVWFSR